MSNNEELSRLVAEYVTIQERIKDLEALQKPIKTRLIQTIEEDGEEDDKQHRWIHLPVSVSGVNAVQRQRRVTVGLDMDVALEILTSKGLDHCIVYKPAIDDDAVAAARFEGLLSDEDIEEMFPKKITWALVLEKDK